MYFRITSLPVSRDIFLHYEKHNKIFHDSGREPLCLRYNNIFESLDTIVRKKVFCNTNTSGDFKSDMVKKCTDNILALAAAFTKHINVQILMIL